MEPALSAISSVLAHWPNEARVYWGLADAYRSAGDLEAAQAAVARCNSLERPCAGRLLAASCVVG